VTDTSHISPGPDDDPGRPPGGGAGGRTAGGRRWLRALAMSAGTLVMVVAGAGWMLFEHLDGNIHTDSGAEAELARHAAQRPPASAHDVQNVLVIGTDSRDGANDEYGRDSGTQRSDTVILLHLSDDRSSATAVSLPRDLMVPVPGCTRRDGHRTAARTAQLNWSFQWGGAACTIRTVEQLTGIRVSHYLVVDFTGFKRMVNAVDGVQVCVPVAMRDPQAHLDLPAGRQVLDGEQALGYVRSRHAVGNGSDTERIERQQSFLASLVHKMQSSRVLFNPARLYPLLDAATKSVVADPGLDSLTKLYDLAASLQHTPGSQIRFLTVPREPYAFDPNRDQLVQPAADELFAALRADRPVASPPAADAPIAVASSSRPLRPTALRDGASDGGGCGR
jgi:LCP family protein required for cell wall assembly